MCVRACAPVVSRRVDLPNLWFIVRNSSRSRSCASFYAPAAPITSRAERALTRARRLRSVWENERSYLSDGDISRKLLDLWHVMDSSIHAGVSSTEPVLPGRLQVRRRAPHLYRRLFKGFYPSLIPPHPSSSSGSSLPPPSATQPLTLQHGLNHHAPPPPSPSGGGAPLVVGSFDHPLPPTPRTKGQFPAIDWLSCYAIAVNEVNASGGRVVTAPTNVRSLALSRSLFSVARPGQERRQLTRRGNRARRASFRLCSNT